MVATEVGVFVAVGTDPPVVKVNVELLEVALPSLAAAYHSYCVFAVRPGQLRLAVEPEATVVVPICVNGVPLPCIL